MSGLDNAWMLEHYVTTRRSFGLAGFLLFVTLCCLVLASAVLMGRLLHNRFQIGVVAVSPGGRTAAIVFCREQDSPDNVVRIWDLASRKELAKVPVEDHLFCMALSDDGAKLATAQGSILSIWDVHDGACLRRYGLPFYTSHAFSPDASIVATAMPDSRTIEVRHVVDGTVQCSLGFLDKADAENRYGTPDISPDGRLLATDDNTGQIHIWDIERQELMHSLDSNGSMHTASFSSDGNLLACRYWTDGWSNVPPTSGVALYDLATGAPPRSIALPYDATFAPPVFTPIGRRLALVTGNGLQLWDSETGEIRQVPGCGRVRQVASASQSRVLVTVGDEAVTVWDATRMRPLYDLWRREHNTMPAIFAVGGGWAIWVFGCVRILLGAVQSSRR